MMEPILRGLILVLLRRGFNGLKGGVVMYRGNNVLIFLREYVASFNNSF
jgi:hypothetical protein